MKIQVVVLAKLFGSLEHVFLQVCLVPYTYNDIYILL